MTLERDWATALSQLRDGRVAVYPALLNATLAKNGDSVLHITLADAGCLEQIETYGVEKVTGFLTSTLKVGQVEFRLPESKNGSTPTAEEAQGDVPEQHTTIPNVGYFAIRADLQRKVYEKISHLDGAGSRIAANVFGWLQGQVENADGWTRAVSLSDAEKALKPNRQCIAEAIDCLHRGGLILAVREPDQYGRRSYKLYAGEYHPRSAFKAQEPCRKSTSEANPRAAAAHHLGVSVDVVDAIRLILNALQQHHPSDSESVPQQHSPAAESAAKAQVDVPEKHTPNPETEHRRGLLRTFGVASPRALDDIIAIMRRYWHGLDWLLGWMIEYQYRWITNVDELRRPKWSKDEMVGLFVTQVRSGIDKPPAQALSLAQETLADLESERDFIEDMLREKLAGISYYTFGNGF
ncbi:MAG: hypothetical protein JXB47_09490 [Anaerolineae bacterium]|nr:hypothetical protein [Anaerolineae bacterium]